MKVAFCIPTTSNKKNWKSIKDSFLYKHRHIKTKHDITYFIGYDSDDKIFSKPLQRWKFPAKWIKCDFEKGHVTAIWNKLFSEAIEANEYDYFWLAGDDIIYGETDWLDALISALEKTNGVGIAGVNNGNPLLPMTQFLVSKEHYNLFGFAFPEEIINWYCDNWIVTVYPEKYVHYLKEFECLNSGGEPRYQPVHIETKWRDVVEKYKAKVAHLEI